MAVVVLLGVTIAARVVGEMCSSEPVDSKHDEEAAQSSDGGDRQILTKQRGWCMWLCGPLLACSHSS